MSERAKLYSLTAARLVLGLTMLVHGLANTFGVFGGPGMEHFARQLAAHVALAPNVIAWIAALVQLLGGVLLLLGLWARRAAFLLLVFVALQLVFGRYYVAFFTEHGGCEHLLALMALCGVVAAHGPGAVCVEIRSRPK